MGTYLTYSRLAAGGLRTLADIATPDGDPVPSADLLRLALDGSALDETDPEAAVALQVKAAIDSAIARAEGALNGSVTGRYAVPLTLVDDFVLGLLCDLAWWYLHPPGREVADVLVKRADQARADLKRIQSGDLLLGAAPAGAAGAAGGMPDYSAADALFSADDLDAYRFG